MMSIYSPNSATLTSAVTGGDPAALVLAGGVSEWANAAYGAVGARHELRDGAADKALVKGAIGAIGAGAGAAVVGEDLRLAMLSGAAVGVVNEVAGLPEGESKLLAAGTAYVVSKAAGASSESTACRMTAAAEQASDDIRHNRDMHPAEVMALKKAVHLYGRSVDDSTGEVVADKEAERRYIAAALSLSHFDATIAAEDTGEAAREIRALVAEGREYKVEQQRLIRLARSAGSKEAFTYTETEASADRDIRQHALAVTIAGTKDALTPAAMRALNLATRGSWRIHVPYEQRADGSIVTSYGLHEAGRLQQMLQTGRLTANRVQEHRIAAASSAAKQLVIEAGTTAATAGAAGVASRALAPAAKAMAATAVGKEAASIISQAANKAMQLASKADRAATEAAGRAMAAVTGKQVAVAQGRMVALPTPQPALPTTWQMKGSGKEVAASAGQKAWTVKGRIKAAQLPTKGKVRFVPRRGYKPTAGLDKFDGNCYRDKFNNLWKKGPSRTVGEPFEWDVQLSPLGKKHFGWASRDGKHLNVSMKGRITHE